MPALWYKEQVLGEKKTFISNTGTIIGTIVHAGAEEYGLNQKLPEDYEALCDTYIEEQYLLNPEINRDQVRELYPKMLEALIENYLKDNLPDKVEQQVVAELKDGVFVGGTIDALNNGENGTIVVDYKNVSKKPAKVEDPSFKIPFNHKVQMLAYASALRHSGEEVDSIRVVYVVRPTAKLPIRVFTVTRTITTSDWNLINSVLLLISESVLKVRESPECAPLLFKAMYLKRNSLVIKPTTEGY